jgi:tRNA (guanine-N7-)-methyltransferase
VRKLTNVRLACADARNLIRTRIPTESVVAIHIYFLDSWWKKRHHKRRVFTAELVESCTRALCPGSQINLATDVPDYFAVMKELCSAQRRLEHLPPPPILDEENFAINFERKAKEAGQPVHRALYRKIA